MCVCVCLCIRKWDVLGGRTSDANLQTQQRMVKNVGQGLEPSRMSGAASGHNRRAAAELDAIGELAVAETVMIGEQ